MIPVSEPLFAGNEATYLAQAMASGWLSSEGPFVKRFEEEFAAFVGRKHAIAVSSGTAALDIAVEAVGIGHGEEVIVPTFTIISCINQILRAGAYPVFVDCDPLTFNMDVTKIEAAITKRTVAIMVVHIYGLSVDMSPVLALARKYGLKVIEDAAQVHGQRYNGKMCGSFGDISTFSFYSNKIITTGEGGMVLTDDDELAVRCRELRNLCHSAERYVHNTLGWVYRMTNLQAAVGCAQLERVHETIGRKRAMGATYNRLLWDLQDRLQLPSGQGNNLYWVYPLVSETRPAAEIVEALREHSIDSRRFFHPLHMQPLGRLYGFVEQSLPNAEHIAKYGFYIPSGAAVTLEQMSYVARVLSDIV